MTGSNIARDNGETKNHIKEYWNLKNEEEPIVPTICHWANGEIKVEKTVVFNVVDSETLSSPEKKTAPKSTTSYMKKKLGTLSVTSKKFKDFKPKAEPIKESSKQVEKDKIDVDLLQSDFYQVKDVDIEIEKLRVKVENEAKRRKIEEDIKKRKRKLNRITAAGGTTVVIGNKPFTTDINGKPILINAVNVK